MLALYLPVFKIKSWFPGILQNLPVRFFLKKYYEKPVDASVIEVSSSISVITLIQAHCSISGGEGPCKSASGIPWTPPVVLDRLLAFQGDKMF